MSQTFVRTSLLGALIASTSAASPQATARVSVDSAGTQGNDWSDAASISADGRYTAFQSQSTNFVRGDANGSFDVFIRDRQLGLTECVSVDSNEVQGNSVSYSPSISADGRYVVFRSFASNLVSGDTNGLADIFVRDRQRGTTERVSVDSNEAQANGGSDFVQVSADGRYVAFWSWATNLVSGDTNGMPDIFVRDRQSGTTERVSVDSAGVQGNDWSYSPSISADGRYVAFQSYSSNLAGGDTNGVADIFVRDRQSGTTERVSVDSSGAQGNDLSGFASISADGRYVAFVSVATNLVSGDTNSTEDVFVRDRLSSTTERVSVHSSGAEGDDTSGRPWICADGRYVAFGSWASNLIHGDTNSRADVFVRDRQSGTTERVSVSSAGEQGIHESPSSSISADGRYVAFVSYAANLVSGDTNGEPDVFVRDRNPVAGTKYCAAMANSTGSPADISVSGSSSAGMGYLEVVSSPVPDQTGIFFHGTSQAQVPFGNGFLCVTSDIVRGTVTQAAGNVATFLYDNSDARHSLLGFAGSTRHFQHWFHDPLGGGASFNTSNATSILIEL